MGTNYSKNIRTKIASLEEEYFKSTTTKDRKFVISHNIKDLYLKLSEFVFDEIFEKPIYFICGQYSEEEKDNICKNVLLKATRKRDEILAECERKDAMFLEFDKQFNNVVG